MVSASIKYRYYVANRKYLSFGPLVRPNYQFKCNLYSLDEDFFSFLSAVQLFNQIKLIQQCWKLSFALLVFVQN